MGARDAYDRANESGVNQSNKRFISGTGANRSNPEPAATKQFAALNGEAYAALRKQANANPRVAIQKWL